MRILYFYQYFSTPRGAWGTRVYEFARNWVKQGHKVTVVTAIYYKSDITAKKFLETQLFDGITVKIINVVIDNRHSIPKRLWTFIQFNVMACFYALRLPCDMVIASSGPILIGLPGLVARYFRRKKLVFEVRDLWPQGAIELGIITNPVLKWVAYKFEDFCYNSSDLIVALSPGMKDNIKQRFNHTKVVSITNGADLALFGESNNGEFLNAHGDYAIYTGNLGSVNNSGWLLETARILNSYGRNDIKILLIGDGQEREAIDEAINKENLSNIMRLDLMPKLELVNFVQNALVSLVPLKGTPVLDHSSPNKFFESLAAGVPVIQNTQGWIKDFLEEHSIGFTVSPNNAKDLADLLVQLFDDKEQAKRMGKNAKMVAEKYFDKDHLSQIMLDSLQDIA